MLLELPSTFRKPSADDASNEIELACDWIEASVLFSGESVASPTVIDLLVESQWFADQQEARSFTDNVWSRLRTRRLDVGGGGPFDFNNQSIELSVQGWEDSPAYAFCLLLAYARHHLDWSEKIKWNYNTQGDIFEALTTNALGQLLPAWTIHRTGWSSKEPSLLSEVVGEVAKRLCGEVKNLKRWNTKNAKEQGLDILCYRQFHDNQGNFPAFFVQCASGRHFKHKLQHPDLEVWNDLVALLPASLPRKAFASPYTFPKRQFEQHAIESKGLFLDRSRLLSAALSKEDWIDSKVAVGIKKWAKKYIKKLPWPT